MIGALVWKPLAYPTTEGTYEQFFCNFELGMVIIRFSVSNSMPKLITMVLGGQSFLLLTCKPRS